MDQIEEYNLLLQECSALSLQMNQEIQAYNELQVKIMERRSILFAPFSLENCDGDQAMEGLVQGTKNVLSRIKNIIIKIWTNIKELVEKALHIFDGTERKLKQYQAVLKTGKEINANNFNKRLTMYPNGIMIKRVDAIMNEINMRWTEANGTPNLAERKSLDAIGFHVRNNNGSVTASYNGAIPREDSIVGHGYKPLDVARVVDNAIALFEQFPKYKDGMIKQFDNFIKTRYQGAQSSEQKASVILMDRIAYMTMHKTMQFILKSIREIGKQAVALCAALEI